MNIDMVNGQWKYSSGGNAFDGKFKTSSVRGSGGEYPNNNPLFVINLFEEKNLGVYFTELGCLCSEYIDILFVFDNNEEIIEIKGAPGE